MICFIEDGQVRRIKKIILHEKFTAQTYNNDIALLELDEPVQFNKNIKPICINEDMKQDTRPMVCFVAGWGRMGKNGHGPTATKLQELGVSIKDG